MRGAGGMPVFAGYQSQYGTGLGNSLAGIARAAIPLVSPLLKSLGQKLFTAGANKLQHALDSRFPPPAPPPPVRREARPRGRGARPVKRAGVKRKGGGTGKSVGPGKRTKRDIFTQ